ncbi:hypothetical protein QNX20_002512 [Cronobacter sakazakii]|nr:hypothetical protein [Cronobacter sakazakii]
MSAKDKLIERISTVEITLQLPQLINQGAGGVNAPNNKSATLLRKGLGIVIFNILEDFLKERTIEMFLSISSSLTSFSNLPNEMREAATLGALKGLVHRATLEKKTQGDWMSLVQVEALNINSTSLVNGFTISPFSLMSEGSNVYPDDLIKAMKCLNIEGGWGTLQKISSLCNGGVLDLKQSFHNISSRRHKAAHVANFDYEHGWLTEAVTEIFAIASSFDMALSARSDELLANPAIALSKCEVHDKLSLRFLVYNAQKNYYSERKGTPLARTIKNWANLSQAIQTIVPRCKLNNERLIILNSQSRIEGWHC